MGTINYDLAQLRHDQEPDFVAETLAALISWAESSSASTGSATFDVSVVPKGPTVHTINVSWDLGTLEAAQPGVAALVGRLRQRRTVALEKQTEFAAYGLAFVVASCVLKKRITSLMYYAAPDLRYSFKTKALKGIEVAGRAYGSWSALIDIRDGALITNKAKTKKRNAPRNKSNRKASGGVKKRSGGKYKQLRSNSKIAEAYLSLWSRSGLALLEKVKP